MTGSEIEALLKLAEARNQTDRRKALRWFADHARGLNTEQIAVLRKLADESIEQATAVFRRLPNAAETSKFLRPVRPGPRPEMSPSVAGPVEEWLRGWEMETELKLAGATLPGPLFVHGPSGTGKSTLVKWIAQRFEGRKAVCYADAHLLVDSLLGGTGNNLAEMFGAAANCETVLVLEEFDAIGCSRLSDASAAGREGNRVTIALMRLFEEHKDPIIATSNCYHQIDEALKRRFEYQVEMATPDHEAQQKVVHGLCGHTPEVELLKSTGWTWLVSCARRAKRLAMLRGEPVGLVLEKLIKPPCV